MDDEIDAAAPPPFRTVVGYGIFYGLSSACMLLGNKVALYYFPVPALVCTIQYAFTVGVCLLLHVCGTVTLDFSMKTVRSYWKVPALFAVAIWTNGMLLKNANVETFIVCRNTTPLLVALCDFAVMKKNLPTLRSLFAFTLIIIGAAYYTATDSEFSLRSYAWAVAYLTTIVVEMVYVKHIFNSVQMTTWSRVFYNNALSLPLQPIFAILSQETVKYSLIISGEIEGGGITVTSLGYLLASCFGGLSIAFAGTAFRNLVSATTFTTVGVANKIITVTVNYVIWDKHANGEGLVGLSTCLVGSLLYQPASKRTRGNFSDRAWKRIVAPCNKKQQQQGYYAMVALDENNNGSDSLRPEFKKSGIVYEKCSVAVS